MRIDKEQLISEIVAGNYKTASVFKKYGIDFCCNGNRTIGMACTTNKLDTGVLISELESKLTLKKDTNDYLSWSIGFLTDHIYNTHHKYVESTGQDIRMYLDKLCRVHGSIHPELFEINELFTASVLDLAAHMKKEELILFPYFKKLSHAAETNQPVSSPQFDSVMAPITMMHHDHDNEGERFRMIAKLSGNYAPPEDACNTYRVTFSMLQEFEEDLHLHIHLENNILFKKAVELEKELNH